MFPPAHDPPISPIPVPAPADHRSPVARIVANMGHLLGGKVAAGLLSLVYLVLATRTLGAHGYGVLVLVNAYAVFVGSLVAFSGFHGVVRYGALAIERGDRDALAGIVRFMGVVELGCGVVAVLAAAVLTPWIGPRLGWSAAETRLAIVYSLAVLATVRATPQGLLQLAGRFDLIGRHAVVNPLVRMIGAGIAWGLGAGLPGFLLAWLAAALAEGVAMWLLAIGAWRTLLGATPFRGPWRGIATANGGFTRFILTTNFDITLRELAPQAVPLTVGWILGPAAAGLLALAQRATSVLQQPATLLANGSYSVLAELAAAGGGAPLTRAVWRSAVLMAMGASAIVLILSLLGDRLLVWIGGATFAGGTALMLLVAVGRAVALATTPHATGLTALGRPDRSVAAALLANVALYPLLPLFLFRFGAIGAGWHAIVQNAAAGALLAWSFARATRPDMADGR